MAHAILNGMGDPDRTGHPDLIVREDDLAEVKPMPPDPRFGDRARRWRPRGDDAHALRAQPPDDTPQGVARQWVHRQAGGRTIRSVENSIFPPGTWDGVTAEQSNTTKAGIVGVNWLVTKNLRLHAESEFGTNNNPFTPISLRDYHSVRARGQYRTKKYTIGGAYADNYNTNSIAITAYSSRARNYSGDVSVAAKSCFSRSSMAVSETEGL